MELFVLIGQCADDPAKGFLWNNKQISLKLFMDVPHPSHIRPSVHLSVDHMTEIILMLFPFFQLPLSLSPSYCVCGSASPAASVEMWVTGDRGGVRSSGGGGLSVRVSFSQLPKSEREGERASVSERVVR